MTEPVSERTRQRRRILRAAAGVPIVLTLPSGAALAATSATCETRNTTTDPLPKLVEPSPDGWVRFRVDAYDIPQQNSTGPRFDVSGFQLDGKWWKVDDGSAVEVTLLTPDNSQNRPTLDPEGKNYYLMVDYAEYDSLRDPSFYTYPTVSDPESPTTGSCWTSLTGVGLNFNLIN